MRVELGEMVRTVDGKDVGAIKYLIVDPMSRHVQSVVIEQGMLFKDDHEVPLEAIQEAPEGGLMLTYTADNLHELPHFDMSRYTEPDNAVLAEYNLPGAGVLWPNTTPFPGTVAGPGVYPIIAAPQDVVTNYAEGADRRNGNGVDHQEHNVVVSEGSDVVTMDGDKVGEVHHISFDAVSGRPIQLIVKKGFLFTQDIEIPVEEIASVERGIVMLRMSAEDFKGWAAKSTSAPLI